VIVFRFSGSWEPDGKEILITGGTSAAHLILYQKKERKDEGKGKKRDRAEAHSSSRPIPKTKKKNQKKEG